LKVLSWAVEKWRPRIILILSFFLMIMTIGFYFSSEPKIELFPGNEPQFVNVKVELPVGTDVRATDAFMKELEKDINKALEADSAYVESILSTVGKGAVGENEFALGNTPQKGITTITFIDYEDRGDFSTVDKMKELSDKLVGKYPGATISVEKNVMGPPVGKPINIEVIGYDFNELMKVSDSVLVFLEGQNIAGIEGLKLDIDVGKPELMIDIDREKARRFGLSSLQIASTIRTSLFGKEVSDFKEGEEKYPIRIRYSEEARGDIASLMNHTITFRNNMGKLMSIPISAVADVTYSSTYGMVKRKDLDRVVTIYSNVLEGYNPNEINAQLKVLMEGYDLPKGYTYKFTGEQEEMAEAMSFLGRAMLVALGIIILILVTQFNSGGKPMIIMASVLFSTIGVFGGLATFKMPFIVIMSGIGIISLAGIVVNNAIVLIDYIDLLKSKKKRELGLDPDANLDLDDIKECVINAGKTRLRPVLLTAITTVLGLLPMAIGMNIDFAGYFMSFNPDIYIGGQNADFWGPLAWTVIFGLSFATFLTLIVVPMMYLLGNKIKYGVMQIRGTR
jgi:multidrug efflux pump subunit AcrB